MSGLTEPEPITLLNHVSKHIGPFLELLRSPHDVSPEERKKKLKDCLREQQRCLLACLFKDGNTAGSKNPFVWVNTYIECDWGDSGDAYAEEKWLDKILFSPAAMTSENQEMVDDIHENIFAYIGRNGGETHSLTHLLNDGNVPLITAFSNEGDRIRCVNQLLDNLGLPDEACQKYSEMLRMNNNIQWHYVHIASGSYSSKLLKRAGIYLMAESDEAWSRHSNLVVMAFRLFLSELTSAYLLKQTDYLLEEKTRLLNEKTKLLGEQTKLLGEQTRLLDEAEAQRRIFDYIRTPAKELAAQVRNLEVQAGKIQRVLAPLHQNLFPDLQRGSEFFDPARGKVEIDRKLKIRSVHNWEEVRDEDKKNFVLAVLIRVLGLHRQGYIKDWDDMEKLIKRVLARDFRPDFKETTEALRVILGISVTKGMDVVDIPDDKWETYFLILKDVCHSPFKMSGFEFDANLCYALFEAERDNTVAVEACCIAPPSEPELFLEGCKAFVDVIPSDGPPSISLINFHSSKQTKSRTNTLRISRSAKTPLFKQIENPARLADLVKHSVDDRSDLANREDKGKPSSKTLLWKWATTPLVGHMPYRDNLGDTVGALVLIFGFLARDIRAMRRGNVVAFSAEDEKLEIKLEASEHMRSVTIKCKSIS